MLPTSLEVLNLAGDDPTYGGTPHKFTGGIPPDWGALTNLKKLSMYNCSLDGKPLSIRAERLRVLLIFQFFAGQLPKQLGQLVNLKVLWLHDNAFEGPLSIRTERLRILLTFAFSAGELPKQLGQLTKLTHFDVSDNELTGALSTCTERLLIFADFD